MFSPRLTVRASPPTATREWVANEMLNRQRQETAIPAASLVVDLHIPNSNICMKMIQPQNSFLDPIAY